MQEENYNILRISDKSNLRKKISTSVIWKKIKSSSKGYVRNALEILTNEKNFSKSIIQQELLFTTFFHNISPDLFKLKRRILSSLT